MKLFYRIFWIGLIWFNAQKASLQIKELDLQPYELWWQQFAGTIGFWPDLEVWARDFNTQSRKALRHYIQQHNYTSILDIPCGAGTDYFGLLQDTIAITYQGIEITPKLVDFCQQKNIPVIQGSIENIPLKDNSFDISYARHILEHLHYYHKAIKELIRVARYEVLIVFFIPPEQEPDAIYLLYPRGLPIYNNYYNKKKIEEYMRTIPKVSHWIWEKVTSTECFLHIYLK